MSAPPVPYQNLVDDFGRLIVETTTSTAPLRFYKLLRGLAIAELVLGIIAFVFNVATFAAGISRGSRDGVYNIDFTGVWLHILFIIACSLGVGSLRIPSGSRCPLIAYFVLLIIFITLSPIYIGVTSVWTNIANNNCWQEDHRAPYIKSYNNCPFFALNIILLLIGIAEMILSIISTSFLCYVWKCCGCCAICCGCDSYCNENENPRTNVF